ncbi:probable beta-1,3-galactosyltransferase 14 [Aegilops tauschii subsp. strangulata]|uniref:probable beta-1,3-galactosyltransferase 14 n=1 Tax=Aegilops tauschii subsp. strangulata TaxID=200361 RepID=UPI003CC86B07
MASSVTEKDIMKLREAGRRQRDKTADGKPDPHPPRVISSLPLSPRPLSLLSLSPLPDAHQIHTHRRPRRSSLRRLLSSPAVSAACLLFGLARFLAAAVSLSRAPAEAPRGRCPDSSHPLSVSVAWDRRPGDAAGGATDLPAGLATGSRGRHKVMAFVGIFTGFGSVGRCRALRRTWLPSDRQGLLRLVVAGTTASWFMFACVARDLALVLNC